MCPFVSFVAKKTPVNPTSLLVKSPCFRVFKAPEARCHSTSAHVDFASPARSVPLPRGNEKHVASEATELDASVVW